MCWMVGTGVGGAGVIGSTDAVGDADGPGEADADADGAGLGDVVWSGTGVAVFALHAAQAKATTMAAALDARTPSRMTG